MVVSVVPAFRAAASVAETVSNVLPYVDAVVVVDDACPHGSGAAVVSRFANDARVHVVSHNDNRGVGAAMKTGMRLALELGADTIVKIDADGQMDPAFIPSMLGILRHNGKVGLVKGNRFYDGSVRRTMPILRLIGNSILTLLVRLTTGFWGSIDPTNGYFAVRAQTLRRIGIGALADRYYFEISLLSALATKRIEIAEIEMPAIYGSVPSGLSISKTALEFPFRLFGSFVKRVSWQYVIADMNVGSMLLIAGLFLTALGAGLGSYWWAQALQTGTPRTPGTVLLAFAPLLAGFQLLLNSLLYDVQFATRVHKYSVDDRTNSNVTPMFANAAL